MEDIKRVMKNSGITVFVILVYGIIIQSKEVYFGMTTGALVSIFAFYLLCMDVKNIVATQNGTYKRAILGYMKRYIVYAVYLGVMAKFWGLSMILCSGMGLLNTRFNITLIALSDKFLKIRDKSLK